MHLSCEICIELITTEENVEVTSCGHIFHSTCIKEWFEHKNNSCPHCQKDRVSAGLIKLFFNSAENENFHLDRNCETQKTKHDLEILKEENEKLKTELSSLKVNTKSELEQLNLHLNAAINKNEINEKKIKETHKMFEKLGKSMDCIVAMVEILKEQVTSKINESSVVKPEVTDLSIQGELIFQNIETSHTNILSEDASNARNTDE